MKQAVIISDFRVRINDMMEGGAEISQDMLDVEQKSLDEASKEEVSHLADQLNFALAELDRLERMQVGDRLNDHVSMGAVVKTDKMTFYPSVSLERFEVNGEELFGISDQAPLYQAMKGKKAGDTFGYGENSYKILDVF